MSEKKPITFSKKYVSVLTLIFILSIASLTLYYSWNVNDMTNQYNTKISEANTQTLKYIDMITNDSSNAEQFYDVLAAVANSTTVKLDSSWHSIENSSIMFNSTSYSYYMSHHTATYDDYIQLSIPTFTPTSYNITSTIYSNGKTICVQLYFPDENITSPAYLLTDTVGNSANYQP